MNSWEHVSSKLGNIKGETRSIAKELYDVARANGHEIWFMWGMGTSTEHSSGLALDLMIRNKTAGDFLYDYIWRERARLRLRHVIWWQHITSTVNQPGVRRKMADRGNATVNHLDHLHVLVMAGSYHAPAEAKPPTVASNLIKRIQSAVKTTDDGMWGPNTDRAVMRMRLASRIYRGYPIRLRAAFDIREVQRVINTKVDGVFGPNSRTALVAWIKNFQKVISVRSDGLWGPKTDGKLLTIRRRSLNRY